MGLLFWLLAASMTTETSCSQQRKGPCKQRDLMHEQMT
jgi:hypothetical protein